MLDFSVITGKAIHQVLFERIDRCMEVVRTAYLHHGRGQTTNPPSYFLTFPDRPSSRIIALPASVRGDVQVSGIKWIASYPENIRRGIPRASAVLVLNDLETGYPLALLESSIISAARTSASALLAAEAVQGARRVRRLGIVGTGLIARYLYQFMQALGWEVEAVSLHDLSRSESERFAREVIGERGPGVQIEDAIEPLLKSSDVIVFTTVAGKPHVHDPKLFAHRPLVLHISLRDLAPEILAQSWNVVDDVEHCLKANTSPHLLEQQVGHRDFIHATIPQLLAGEVRLDRSKPVIVSPFGLGVLDLAVGKWIYDEVRARGADVRVEDFFYDLKR